MQSLHMLAAKRMEQLEGMNSGIQTLKCRARGFRNMEYFKIMIYLVCGKPDLDVVMFHSF